MQIENEKAHEQMMSLSYCLLVTGPAYGTQRASSAYLFAKRLTELGHRIECVFFYREGIHNANGFISPANDEFNLLQAWQILAKEHNFDMHICVSAAMRRGVIDENQAKILHVDHANLAPGFELSGLGSLAEAMLQSDRVIQF